MYFIHMIKWTRIYFRLFIESVELLMIFLYSCLDDNKFDNHSRKLRLEFFTKKSESVNSVNNQLREKIVHNGSKLFSL